MDGFHVEDIAGAVSIDPTIGTLLCASPVSGETKVVPLSLQHVHISFPRTYTHCEQIHSLNCRAQKNSHSFAQTFFLHNSYYVLVTFEATHSLDSCPSRQIRSLSIVFNRVQDCPSSHGSLIILSLSIRYSHSFVIRNSLWT